MFNPLGFISNIIKSSNQKELDRISKIVNIINSLEKDTIKLKDEDFPKKTLEFREKIKNGQSLDKILPEAYALVREASRRSRKCGCRRLSSINESLGIKTQSINFSMCN